MSQSISAILEQTLHLDSKQSGNNPIDGLVSTLSSITPLTLHTDHNSQQQSQQLISTSRILLNELKKRSESTQGVIKLAPKKEKQIDPLLIQIAESKTDPPTYWKDTGIKNTSNESSLMKRSREMIENSNIPLPAGHKQKQIKRNRGEAYSDRLNHKLSSQDHRKQRLEKYAKIY